MPDVPLPSIPDKFHLTPEFRLLAACSWIAPPVLEQDQAEKIVSLCRGVIDWDAFIGLVRRHGVPALAYTMLSRHAGDMVPGAIRETLKAGHVQSAGQALFQAAELVRLIKLFAGKGIDIIPLKGVFLSHQLYGDLGMRSSGDLDILVRPEHVDLVEKTLEFEGYFCDFMGLKLTQRQKQHARTHLHHFDFVHQDHGLHVELHWNLGAWLPEQLAVIISHTVKRDWQGVSVDTLDDDSLLLMLCDHGARHDWLQLKWLSDVARMIASTNATAWGSIIPLAYRLDLQRTLAQSALLVYWIYGITIPSELCNLIRREHQAISLSKDALHYVLMEAEEVMSFGKKAQRLRAALQMKRLRPSLPYSLVLKSCLVPLEDFQVLHLPACLFWLYYPLRPILWFWRNYILKR